MQVNSLFDNERPRHVESLNFSLEVYEEAIESKERSNEEDHSNATHKQKSAVKVPIDFGELFKRRSIKRGEPEIDVRVVLLVGNPGTGEETV